MSYHESVLQPWQSQTLEVRNEIGSLAFRLHKARGESHCKFYREHIINAPHEENGCYCMIDALEEYRKSLQQKQREWDQQRQMWRPQLTSPEESKPVVRDIDLSAVAT